ncbi:MAG: nucleotide exchange factor GrpE [Myxococcota bacterium]
MSQVSDNTLPEEQREAVQEGRERAEQDDVVALQARVAEAERQAAELKDRLLRQAAETENYRKRVRKELDEAEARGRDRLLADMLEVVDNLQRALSHAPADDVLAQGVRMVEKQFLGVLSRYDVTPFDSVGQPFDPSLHEAIQMVPTPGAQPNTVLQQVSAGYKQGSRLLRPARVVVATEPEQ